MYLANPHEYFDLDNHSMNLLKTIPSVRIYRIHKKPLKG